VAAERCYSALSTLYSSCTYLPAYSLTLPPAPAFPTKQQPAVMA